MTRKLSGVFVRFRAPSRRSARCNTDMEINLREMLKLKEMNYTNHVFSLLDKHLTKYTK
jgi:hypothetical protein